jgi:hypothetical protein
MEGKISPREMIPPTNSIAAATVAAAQLNSATSNSQAAVAAVTKKLYPASMIGTLGEAYFRTRKEMGCPRGAVSKKYFECTISNTMMDDGCYEQ